MTDRSTRRRFIKAAGVAGVAALAGCGGGDGGDGGSDGDGGDGGSDGESGGSDGGDAETRLSWHAGGTGGTYFPLSNEFKTVVEDNTESRSQTRG